MRLLFYLFIVLLTASCSNVNRIGYNFNPKKFTTDTCNIPIQKGKESISNDLYLVGVVEIGEHPFGKNCSESDALETLQREACFLQADVIVITKEKFPNRWSNCYRCDARFYQHRNKLTKDSIPFRKLQVKTSPYRIINPINPGVELGIEHLFNTKHSVQAVFTYLYDPFRITDFQNFEGEKINLEYRYYFKSFFNRNFYLAPELEYFQNRFNADFNYDFLINTGDTSWIASQYTDHVYVEKKALTLNYKMGIQWRSNRFIVDAETGIGLRYRSVHHYDKTFPDHPMTRQGFIDAYYSAYKEGDYFTFNWLFIFRIGYRF